MRGGITRFAAGFPRAQQAVAMHHDETGEALPFGPEGWVHPLKTVTDHNLARFGAVVAAFLGLGEAPALGIKPGGIKVAQGEGELVTRLVVQAALVPLDAQDVIAPVF